MVVAKGRGPWRFWWISSLSRELLVFVGPCRLFFSWHVDSFLNFLSLAFSPPENTGFGFLKFGFWMLAFCESWILDVESWILDLGFWDFDTINS